MINVAYINSFVSEEELILTPNQSVAGNDGGLGFLEMMSSEKLNVVPFIIPTFGVFPKDRKIFVNENLFRQVKFNRVIIRYINLILLKRFTIAISLFFRLSFWLKSLPDSEKKIIIVYNPQFHINYVLHKLLNKSDLYKVIIVADLTPRGHGIIKKLDSLSEEKNTKRYDGVIGVSNTINLDYCENNKFMLLEGGIKSSVKISYQQPNNLKIFLANLYLNEFSGIKILLDAFSLIEKSNYRLIITGKGPLSNLVKSHSKRDSRIEYKGFISKSEISDLRKSADILISPRLPDEFETKYTFPSKLFDYLASGKAVISFDLDGISPGFKNYLNIPNCLTALCLAQMMEKIIPNSFEKAKNQVDFINEKVWKNNMQRFYEFILEVIGEA